MPSAVVEKMLLNFTAPNLPAHVPSGVFKLFLQVPVNPAPLSAGGLGEGQGCCMTLMGWGGWCISQGQQFGRGVGAL